MRVYLDKQIFSHLFKNNKDDYKKLYTKLIHSKSNVTFCYSNAHIQDLSNDPTGIKFEELEFMKNLVERNYISYDSDKKTTNPYLVYPYEAFDSHSSFLDSDNYESLFDNIDTTYFTDEQKQKFESTMQIFNDSKIDFSFLKYSNIPPQYQQIIDKVIPNKKEMMSIKDIFEVALSLVDGLYNDKTIYKNLRGYIDNNFNNGKYTLNYNDINFNDDLKNSSIEKSFIEFVKDNLFEKDLLKISNYDFYVSAYMSLDLLGISKEPSGKVKFKNLLNDSLHSYYGAHCDIVVSEDIGFLKKSKALYKLLKIDTKIMHINDFIKSYSFSIGQNESGAKIFTDLLENDLANGLVINEKKSLKYNRITQTIKSSNNYLGHFNKIDVIKQDGNSFIYLYHKVNNYSNFIFYSEIELIINNSIRLFGIDSNLKGEFEQKEIFEINNNKWEGRTWNFNKYKFLIEINEGTREIGMTIDLYLNNY